MAPRWSFIVIVAILSLHFMRDPIPINTVLITPTFKSKKTWHDVD